MLTTLALIPAFSIIAFNELGLRQSREAEVHQLARRFGELGSLEMQRVVTGAAALMVAVANTPLARGERADLCGDYVTRMQRQLPQLTTISVTNAEGEVWCATGSRLDDLRVELNTSLRETLQVRPFAVGEYIETSRGAGLELAAAIIADDGATRTGYVFAVLSTDYLGELLKERQFAQDSSLTIADRNGIILAREPDPERFVGTKVRDEFQHLITADRPGTTEIAGQDGIRRIVGYYPASTSLGLYVGAGVSIDEAFDSINQATQRGVLLAVGGAIIAYLLAWLFGRRFIREPVLHLVRTIEAWKAGNVGVRTGMVPGANEISQAGAAVDGLLDELAVRQAAREEAERRQALLNSELGHRIKNILATVRAVASQTFRGDDDPKAMMRNFDARLSTLAEAHALLTAQQWESASISELLRTAVSSFQSEDRPRFIVRGPDVELKSKAALTLAMAVHELATNAVKYGALKSDNGQVEIEWSIDGEGDDARFGWTWTEKGGPAVMPPTRTGFGTRMIQRGLASDFGTEVVLDFAPGGLVCQLSAPLENVLSDAALAARRHAEVSRERDAALS